MIKCLVVIVASAAACSPPGRDQPIVDAADLKPDAHAADAHAADAHPADAHPADAHAFDAQDPDAALVMNVTGTKRMFVSSGAYQGALGGLAGADATCALLAGSVTPTGVFKAWLSSATISAAARLTHSTGPYVLVDGTTVVAASWTVLVGAQLQHAIDVDETGHPFVNHGDACGVVGNSAAVWTGTAADGTSMQQGGVPDASCDAWTVLTNGGAAEARIGNAVRTDFNWTNSECYSYCNEAAALYCVEQ